MEKIIIELTGKDKLDKLLKILEELDISYTCDSNPSPSGDRWFLDSENIDILEKGIDDEKTGRVSSIKDVNNIWESIP